MENVTNLLAYENSIGTFIGITSSSTVNGSTTGSTSLDAPYGSFLANALRVLGVECWKIGKLAGIINWTSASKYSKVSMDSNLLKSIQYC